MGFLTQEDLAATKSLFSAYMDRLVGFLLHPRATFRSALASDSALGDAAIFAGVMFCVGIAVSHALSIPGSLEASSAVFITIGMVVVWLAYAVFMHGFAYLFGARQGVKATVAAFLFAIGSLQPVLVFLLAAVLYLFPGTVEYGALMGRDGTSSVSNVGEALVSGSFLVPNVAVNLRAVSGLLVVSYFSIGLVEAHKLRWRRVLAAIFTALAFFVVLFMIVYAVAESSGNSSLVRLLVGT